MNSSDRILWLREDDTFALFRSQRRSDRDSVLIVSPTAEKPSRATLSRLQRAYLLRHEIDRAWGTRPIAVIAYEGRPSLLLEDPGGGVLDALLGQLAPAQFLRVATAIAESVSGLHEAGLVHRDLKPSNILVDTTRNQAWLTGLCLASHAGKSAESLEPSTSAEFGAFLPYMAPEQTGLLLERSVDPRSDLYSLGVTLYRLATGNFPFVPGDPMDWLHSHVAKRPIAPADNGSRLPETVDAILVKLLEKDPDDRYQSAAGLASDLRRSLVAFENTGTVPRFLLGALDSPERRLSRPRFHGRARELDELGQALERVHRSGKTELLLVRGYSGIGKSSLVQEFLGARLDATTLVGRGKLDELEGKVPYAALSQVLRELCQRVLAEDAAELAAWRAALHTALGPNSALLTQLVPELELVLGRQPALPVLPPEESRNRAFATFRRFFSAIAGKRPLLLFVDDLHWLDTTTIELLADVLAAPELANVLFVGAYRVHAITHDHALDRAMNAIRASGRAVRTLDLPPLPLEEVRRLVADSVHGSDTDVGSLARVIEQRTGGIPFFVGQLLATLVEEGLLRFDQRSRSWAWSLEAIMARAYTENLAELVGERLVRLPTATRDVLGVLACLGCPTPAALLSELLGRSPQELRGVLQPAVDARVVVRSADGYGFPHDRLQETVHSMIPEPALDRLHLELGRALRERPSQSTGDGAFDVVRHLNRASHLIDDPAERIELARANLALAKRSKATSADASALGHLEAASRLLPSDAWRILPELTFDIALARAESEFLVGDRARARSLIDELSTRTADPVRLGAVVCADLALHITRGDPVRAVEVGLAYLRRAGVSWDSVGGHDVRRQYERLLSGLRSANVAELASLPRMTNAEAQATMDVCATLVSPAYFVDRELYDWLVLYMATLSLDYGNGDASCFAYALLCLVLGPRFGDHALGLEFGRLGAELVDAGLGRFAARVYLPFGVIILPRTSGVHAGQAWIERSFEAASISGDLVYAVYARKFELSSRLACGAPLIDAQRVGEASLEYARRQRFPRLIQWIEFELALVHQLRGVGDAPSALDADDLPALDGELGATPTPFYFWVRKLQARYYAGDFEAARAAHREARRWARTSEMFPEEVEYWLFGALAEAAPGSDDLGVEGLDRLRNHEAELSAWAGRCPATFANKAALVRAERLRCEGRTEEAELEFERAVRLAAEHRFVHEEALAHELAARLYDARGLHSVARAKRSAARACYVAWGALGKVRSLDRECGGSDDALVSLSSGTIDRPLEQLELASVVAALRSVSSSLELETLIEGLMRAVLQHAAAERACLVLGADELRVRAEAAARDGVIQVTPVDAPLAPDALPETVLRFVLRTRERVLVEDGELPLPFVEDGYLQRRRVLSLLCLPILVRGEAIGLLYLENGLTKPSFRPRVLALLDLIASQAATSLENARLYASILDAQVRMSQAERVSRTGSFRWRPVTREVSWSDEMFSIFEMTPPPALNVIRERTHPDDRAVFDAMLHDTASVDGKTIDLRLVTPAGALKHLSVIASRIPGHAEPTYVGTVRDVTASKHAEEALQRTQAALADMTRVASLGEMAAAIAHEVNQPLAAIALNASTCVRWLDGPDRNLEEVREAALRVSRDATRAGAVVQRLRALFSKTDGAKMPVDLADAIQEVVALVRSRIRAAGATLRVESNPDVPAAHGDRVQLQQVLMNLLTNALEALRDVPHGARELSIHIRRSEGDRVLCEVRDTGPGVPPVSRDRIFEPFYTTKPEGMGIGLSIARNIVESHGGKLRVRDDEGARGATFYFDLPGRPEPPSSG